MKNHCFLSRVAILWSTFNFYLLITSLEAFLVPMIPLMLLLVTNYENYDFLNILLVVGLLRLISPTSSTQMSQNEILGIHDNNKIFITYNKLWHLGSLLRVFGESRQFEFSNPPNDAKFHDYYLSFIQVLFFSKLKPKKNTMMVFCRFSSCTDGKVLAKVYNEHFGTESVCKSQQWLAVNKQLTFRHIIAVTFPSW